MPWRWCRIHTNQWVQCTIGPGATWSMDCAGKWHATYNKAPLMSRQQARGRACQFLCNCPEEVQTLIREAHGDDTYQRLTIYQYPVDKQYWKSTMCVGCIFSFGSAQQIELYRITASKEGVEGEEERQMYLAMIRLSITPKRWDDKHCALLNCLIDGARCDTNVGVEVPSWVRF